MERFLKSIYIDNIDDFDLDFDALSYDRFIKDRLNMNIVKKTPWEFSFLDEFLDHLHYIEYNYQMTFSYIKGPSKQDVIDLFFQWYRSLYRLIPDIRVNADENQDQIIFTYESKEEASTFKPVISDFRSFLNQINYQFELIEVEDISQEVDNDYSEEEKEKAIQTASKEAIEDIKESQENGNDYSYIDKMQEDQEETSSFQKDFLKIAKENLAQSKRQRERTALNRTGDYPHVASISQISPETTGADFDAYVFKADSRPFGKERLISIEVYDQSSAITVRGLSSYFGEYAQDPDKLVGLKLRIQGIISNERQANNLIVEARFIDILPSDEVKKEKSKTPRVELHLHTNRSTLDGVSSIEEYCRYAAGLGHSAIALTDHAVVQSFPDAYKAAKETGLKMIYGCEVNLVDEKQNYVFNPTNQKLENATYVVLDLETSGLSVVRNNIIEFGAVRVEKGVVVSDIDTFINPGYEIGQNITNLTHITNKDLENAPKFYDVIDKILKFMDGAILVTHNASFDYGFLNAELKRNGKEPLTNPVIDTLALSRYKYPYAKEHNLGALSRRSGVYYDEESAHRANYDAEVLNTIWQNLLSDFIHEGNILTLNDLYNLESPVELLKHVSHPYHATVLAKNQKGLKELYKLVSTAHIDYNYGSPKTPRKLLNEKRENLLIGSGCLNGEIFEVARNKTREELKEKMSFYDFIEVQPLENYSWLIHMGELKEEEIKEILISIIECAQEIGKPVVATGDVHYCTPADKEFRDVYISTKDTGKTARHPLNPRSRDKLPHFENPDQHFRSTDEMLDAFSFLGKEKAYEIVVTNSNYIASLIQECNPVPNDKLYTPQIKDSDKLLKDICYSKAHEIYGDPLPEFIENRLSTELNGIITHGYAVIYYLAYLVTKKCLDDGYIRGSRGSVGSSFAATMAGITEVNPLPPHYVCPKCHYLEWGSENNPKVRSGYDLPDKVCPHCGTKLKADGQNIPFETFLGFEAEKTPDIDLNLSNEYQKIAHNYLKEYLGEDHVFRAGTIESFAEKTAYAKVLDYLEWKGLSQFDVPKAKIDYLVSGCTKVKRTTGQHPGGLIIVPSDYDIYDFSPIQYPADETDSSWKTTHFDYHSLHDSILKLDLLGHVDPTAIKMMSELTGVNYDDIPFNDSTVISLFSSTDALHLHNNVLAQKTGCLGLPEYGTEFVRGIIETTVPKSFADLVIIEGISHGTEVWQGNAETLIKNGTAELKDVIGCRDDIMTYLMSKDVPSAVAFQIMEDVRRGKGVKKEYEEIMKACNVPSYYINSCNKIAYLFPKGHATAYAMMGYRVAYFKVYYPMAYYATFFSVRSKQFDIKAMISGEEAVIERYNQLRDLSKKEKLKPKDSETLKTLQIAVEMVERGYSFKNISLTKSDSVNFLIDEDEKSLIPPFIALDGVGENVAQSIVDARKQKEFTSKQDLKERTLLSSTNILDLESLGVLDDLSETDVVQLSLFDF